MNKQKQNNNEKTFKHAAAGGLLGMMIGVPGLGVALGAAHANKDKIKKFSKKFDQR